MLFSAANFFPLYPYITRKLKIKSKFSNISEVPETLLPFREYDFSS